MPSKSEQELTVANRSAAAPMGMVYLEPLQNRPTSEADSNGMLEYFELLRGHKLLVLAMLLLGTGAGCIISFLQVPIYEAHSYLEFQSASNGGDAAGMGDHDGNGFSSENFLTTQVKVLQSMSLQKRVEAKVRDEYPKTAYAAPGRLTAWRKAFGLSMPRGARTKALAPVEVTARVVENSRIIEILCDSPDPQYSAAFANTMAKEYIEYSLESVWASANKTAEWMNKQLDRLKTNLQQSENHLQQYSQNSGLVYTGAEQSIEEDALKQLQAEYATAKADRIAKQSLSEMAASSQVDSIPEVVDNGRLGEYQRKMAELRQELAELLTLYTPSHYRVMKVQAEITALTNTIGGERKTIRTRIENEYAAARRREDLLSAEYGKQMDRLLQTDRKSVYYDILKHEVDTDRSIYDQLLQKTKQVEVGSAVQASGTRILDPAEVPARPSRPNLARNASFGFLFGLFGAFGLVFALEFIDRSVRAPGEAPFHLQVPELGVIPSQKYFPQAAESRGPRSNGHRPGGQSFELSTWQDHPSLLAESFRSALASIMVSGNGATLPGVIMITSAGKGEGKSSIVSNLGIALAEINQRVLLVDADMRKPHLHDIFNVANSWGLSDLLREKSSLENSPVEGLCRKTDIEGLHLLPSGPGTLSIANLLYSRRLFELLQKLRAEFDIVVIDTPPMLYISDARVLGRLADGAILVIRASKTTRDAARAAKQRLVDDGIPVLGTILNEYDLRKKSRYGYYNSYTY
ncbi:MAG TPA: polysaccharide biosynthesis tyrosine autokinase [Bryobacteraceae bacterium]